MSRAQEARRLNDPLVIFLFIVIAVLLLIPLGMIGRLLMAIISSIRQERQAQARKITRTVNGLGEFSTTDNELWLGNVQGLQVAILNPGRPPTESQASRVREILNDLPHLVENATAYVLVHEDSSWRDGDARAFEAYGLEPETETRFVLELTHPADLDGVYRVTFENGEPTNCARDD